MTDTSVLGNIGPDQGFLSLDRRVLRNVAGLGIVASLGALVAVWVAGGSLSGVDPSTDDALSAPVAAPTAARDPFGTLAPQRYAFRPSNRRVNPGLLPRWAFSPATSMGGAGFTPPARVADANAAPVANADAAPTPPLRDRMEMADAGDFATAPLPPRRDPADIEPTAPSIPLPPLRPRGLPLAAAANETPAPTRGPVQRLARRGEPALPAQADNRGFFEKLFGDNGQTRQQQSTGPALAYARPDDGLRGPGGGFNIFGNTNTRASAPIDGYDRYTAVYDIQARKVFLPSGEALEAHSGLGAALDDPGSVHIKNRGATPPNVYDLSPRKDLFHGVQALRLTPVGDKPMFGRDGILAHSFMLGPNGDSNGCVSFRNYSRFLQAYQNGEIKRLVVVAHRG